MSSHVVFHQPIARVSSVHNTSMVIMPAPSSSAGCARRTKRLRRDAPLSLSSPLAGGADLGRFFDPVVVDGGVEDGRRSLVASSSAASCFHSVTSSLLALSLSLLAFSLSFSGSFSSVCFVCRREAR